MFFRKMLTFVVALLLTTSVQAQNASTRKPNILIIVTPRRCVESIAVSGEIEALRAKHKQAALVRVPLS
jgi:hypothetical protein